MIRGGLVTLPVNDANAAVRFYIETLGMKLVEEGPGLAVLDAGDGFELALASGGPALPTSDPVHAEVGARVTLRTKLPFEETLAILENRGVSFEVRDSAGRVAEFRDPDGNRLRLVPARV